MRYSVVVILLVILADAAYCKLSNEALRVAIGKFLKASFDHKTDCLNSTNASEDLVTKFWDDEYTGENDQPLKCYLYCSYLKTGIVDEKSKLILDALTNKNGVVYKIVSHKPQVTEKLIEFCAEPKSPDPCESAFQLTQCGFKTFREA